MIYPWYIHDISMIYPWYIHDISMISPWYIHDISMIYPWYIHDISMIYPWYIHDISMIYPWYIHDISMIYPWYSTITVVSSLWPYYIWWRSSNSQLTNLKIVETCRHFWMIPLANALAWEWLKCSAILGCNRDWNPLWEKKCLTKILGNSLRVQILTTVGRGLMFKKLKNKVMSFRSITCLGFNRRPLQSKILLDC